MQKEIYLRDGQIAILHQELENGEYIIEKMMMYYAYEGEGGIEPSGLREVVNKIFVKPPIEKKHDELISIIEKLRTKKFQS